MSSVGQIVGGIAGGVIGFFAGGPAGALQGASIGAGIGGALDPADLPDGPRLEDLKVQMSTYGAPIPFEWGCNRHAGTIIWPRILEAVEHEQTESAKGGPEQTTFTYTLSFAVLVCEGPISGIRRIWANKKLVYDISAPESDDVLGDALAAIYDPNVGQIRFYLGTETQTADPLIEAMDGASPAYRGFAYVVFEDYDVTEMNGRPPQFEFEVITGSETEIPPVTTFGDSFGLGVGLDSPFKSVVDPETGALWVSTMTGHYEYNPVTGEYSLNPAVSVPQIQKYDGITNELLAVLELPVETEQWIPAEDPVLVYPFDGEMVFSGGRIFLGRHSPGWPDTELSPSAYAHGCVIDTETLAYQYLFSECSQEQFQNAFFWPGVPVPVMDNNKVYFVSSNGTISNGGLGFYGAGLAGNPLGDPPTEDVWSGPDRTGDNPLWVTPVGWAQARPNNICPFPPEPDFVDLELENWAVRSTVIDDEHVTIVQGVSGDITDGASYLTWVAQDVPIVTAASRNLDSPTEVFTTYLPGSQSVMPPIAWDAEREILWAFAGSSNHYNTLYGIERVGRALVTTAKAFVFPPVFGQSFGDDVRSFVVDQQTGNLRVLLGGGLSAPSLVTVDPDALTVVETQALDMSVRLGTGRMWDYPEQGKLIYSDGFELFNIPYAAALEPEQIALSTIVSDICIRAGLEAGDIDVTELTDGVDGYIVTRQMTARAAIEPLQTSFFFDAVESEDKIKFVKRDSAIVTTIPESKRAAHAFGDSIPDALSIVRSFELELPYQCEVEYPDVEADHLIGTQYDRRLTKASRQKLTLAAPIVMTAEHAKQIAKTVLYEAWQTERFRFTSGIEFAHLEPTDKVLLPTASASYTARLARKTEQPNGVIEWEAQITDLEIYTQSGEGAAPTDYVSQSIYDPGDTLLALMDTPILRDADNDAGFYVAMAGTRPAWRGAQLFRSSDAGVNFEPAISVADEAAIGVAGMLPDFTAGNIFDEGGTVQVYMTSGLTLTSVTQDQVLNGSNKAVIGAPGRWEVIHFKNAELVAPDTYILSGLLRGCRGTEWATGTHQSGDVFVLASVATWNRINAGDTGLPRVYKAPPLRMRLDQADPVNFTNLSVSLKPFAPVDPVGARNDSNDLALSWNRRTRLAAGTLHMPVLLGETSEAYEIDIMGGEDVVRTITASTTTATYLASEQTADGITPGDPVTVRIYQLSASVARGYPLEATL